MEQTHTNEYIQWIVIVVLTIFIFNYYLKLLGRKLLILAPLVFLSVWVSLVILKLLMNSFLNKSFNTANMVNIMAETLPTVLIFIFITFSVKYLKSSKSI